MIVNKLKRLISKLEDTNIPLLGPNIKYMKFFGLILPENRLKSTLWIIFHFQLCIFVLTQYAELFVMIFRGEDAKAILSNLKYTIIGIVNFVKISSIIIWQKDWLKIFDYVTKSDIEARERCKTDEDVVIKAYTKYCRQITFTYWSFTLFTVVAITLPVFAHYFLLLLLKGHEGVDYESLDFVVSQWMPFDKYTQTGYLLSNVYQSYITVTAGIGMVAFDTSTVVLMVYFKAELELLKIRCTQIFDQDCEEKIRAEIKQCHNKHVDLIKYSKLFNSCISPVMFLYTVVTSANICANVFAINKDSSFLTKVSTIQFAAFGVAQLFLYCWHGNEVFYMSYEPMRGVYESRWWKYKIMRKELQILIAQLDQRVFFTSGPFFNITITSFIKIMKGAYSFYTLVSKK